MKKILCILAFIALHSTNIMPAGRKTNSKLERIVKKLETIHEEDEGEEEGDVCILSCKAIIPHESDLIKEINKQISHAVIVYPNENPCYESTKKVSCAPNHKKINLTTVKDFINAQDGNNYHERTLDLPLHIICADYYHNGFKYHACKKALCIVDLLLQAKINLNEQLVGDYGDTPLHTVVNSIPEPHEYQSHRLVNQHVALKSQIILMKKFLLAGANPYLYNYCGETAFEAAKNSAEEEGCYVLKKALDDEIANYEPAKIALLKKEAKKQLSDEKVQKGLQQKIFREIKTQHEEAELKRGK